MKVVVLVPSVDSLATAGVRIRYERLRGPLSECAVSLVITPIDHFDATKADCDAVIVSKCYDGRGLMAAAILSSRKVKVGLDLFDDYFSDRGDARLSRYRTWLRQMLRLSHFALCSTPAMAQVISSYRGDIPLHILNDPAAPFDRIELADTLDRKLARASSGASLRICWFGIGDNPYFPVGLTDLEAFGGVLREIASQVPVELEILTNKRALEAPGLATIARLPLVPKVDIWSAKRELELLQRTDVCLLPVNAQAFSFSKSLNRAVTALTSGCQVLSLGYPLYASLSGLIYRDANTLLSDWGRRKLRLRPRTLPALEAKIEELACSRSEARHLTEFLQTTSAASTAAKRPIALLHGFTSSQSAHAAVKAAGGLSIATPFCSQQLDFDAVVGIGPGGGPSLMVAADALRRLVLPHRRRDAPTERINGRKYVEIDGSRPPKERSTTRALPVQLALYEPLIEAAATLISDRFGASVFLSEESALPVEPAI